MGFNGIVIGAVITAYFGAVINKAVLEIYREISEKQSEEIKEISSEVIDLQNFQEKANVEIQWDFEKNIKKYRYVLLWT